MHFIGIDVQLRRDCAFAVLDRDGRTTEAGWLPSGEDAAARLRELIERLAKTGPVHVGIDAPRTPLPRPRVHGFRAGRWGLLRGRGVGRHCEVVVRSLGLANPQWTPVHDDAPPWMRLGFGLFEAAAAAERVLEVFPSAAYRALAGTPRSRTRPVAIDLTTFAPGPKDMLDAITAAATVLAVHEGHGCEVGGGDGLGTIALPRGLTEAEAGSPVHDWPG